MAGHGILAGGTKTIEEYDTIADWYSQDRRRSTIGVPEVRALAASLSPGALVLDVGCGPGVPITRTLLDAGMRVVGLDSAGEMLARFRLDLPGVPVIRGTAQRCPCASRVFDAAVAWGVIFHLTHDDQRRAFRELARVVKPRAPFLFTSGDAEDNRTGTMDGVTFHYYAFPRETYRQVLEEAGFELVDVHTDRGDNTYYLARKIA